MEGPALRLVLDQNFPQPLLRDVRPWMPTDVEVSHLGQLDDRLRAVSDRQLLIGLMQLGYNGLITTNHKMLQVPEELAAIIATKAVVVATKSMGHDPIRAAGALLLELPGLPSRVRPRRANVFVLNYNRRQSEDPWEHLSEIAQRQGVSPTELHEQVRVSQLELDTPVLDRTG
jgi:hypothetical protein